MKFKKEKSENVIEDKVTFFEKISLKFRKKMLIDKAKTILIIAILFVAFISLNLWANQAELPEIDVTENKIYTLTDASKNAVKNIKQNVKIYSYGFVEDSTLIDLLKQYNKANEKITFEILTEETNYEMVKKHDLSEGYYVLIIQSNGSEKVINAATEFTTYDYSTYQSVDITEQTITNSILALNEENKPKVYFTQGHNEYDESVMGYLTALLKNEAFEIDFVNLATTGKVPDDCDILAIVSPAIDFYDGETQCVKDYINNGGEIFYAMDVISKEIQLPNLQTILDLYGVNIQNGYVLEYASNKALSNDPYIFMPQISSTNKITRDIYTDSAIWLAYAGKVNFKTSEELAALNVITENLLTSSEESAFINDLSVSLENAAKNAEIGETIIASLVTKAVTPAEGIEKTDDNTSSKLVIVSSASFMSDYKISKLNQSYPLSYIASNTDFAINSMGVLGEKENMLTIRKDYASATYTPTTSEHIIVIAIISVVPLLIIIVGIIIWIYRKKRK